MSNRYGIEGDEGSTQPGSGGLVLANKLGITNPEEMAEAELILLEKIYDDVLMENLPVRALTVGDLKTWHRYWLGNVYTRAGEKRSVNLSKGGFMFAAAAQIPCGQPTSSSGGLVGFLRWPPVRLRESEVTTRSFRGEFERPHA
jgi:cell filamentation protein